MFGRAAAKNAAPLPIAATIALEMIGDNRHHSSPRSRSHGHGVNSLIELPPVTGKISDDAYHGGRERDRSRKCSPRRPDNFMDIHHRSIISLAAKNNIPAVYHSPVSARDGGSLSYGADFQDIFRRSARYVASILRGARPSDLPVQMPVKYLMVINLRTANLLGLTVPPSMLLSADEVIE